MAAMSGKYKFPEEDKGYSEGFRELVRSMLKVKPEERPGVQEVSLDSPALPGPIADVALPLNLYSSPLRNSPLVLTVRPQSARHPQVIEATEKAIARLQ